MIFPVKHPYAITQGFHPGHPGIDIAPLDPGRTTRQAMAPEDCTVIQTGYVPSLEGNYAILKGKVKYYYFGHFAKRLVTSGKVKEGQPIGIIGQTGAATGIHTHHEVRDYPFSSGRTDPEKYYKANVKPKEKDVKLDLSTAQYLAYTILGRDGKGGRPDAFTDPKAIADLKKNHVGRVLNHDYIVKLFRSSEAKKYREKEGL